MMDRLIIEGNTVYEIDEECDRMRRRCVNPEYGEEMHPDQRKDNSKDRGISS